METVTHTPIYNYLCTEKMRWPFCFICSYALLVTQCYRRNSESSFSAMNPRRFWNSITKPEGSHIVLSQPCVVSEKNLSTKEDKGSTMMIAIQLQQLAKMHVTGQSDIKQ